MPTASPSNSLNRLLSSLPVEEYELLAPHLKPVTLTLADVVFHPRDHLEHAYFPTTSIISLLTELEDGGGMEVGLVGKEGLAGISAVLGGSETKLGTVQADGMALKIDTAKLREVFNRGETFQTACLRYTHALMTQISQSVVCNVRHPVEGRLARWLLMYHDRLERNQFHLTQEFLANMLGVRRPSVSGVAAKLQRRGLIQYIRGNVKILDRKGLERFACECYPIVKETFDDLLR